MKYLVIPFVVFFFALFSYPSFADPQNEKSEPYRFFDLYGGTWITQGEGSWEKSFPIDGFTGRSELEFQDIDSTLYTIGARIKPYLYFVTLDIRYASGDISSATGTDSDWIDSYLFSKSEFDIDGDTQYWSLDLYLLLYPYRGRITGWGTGEKKPPHLTTLEAFFGRFHYKDELDITNGVQVIPPTGSFSGLNSEYYFEWEGFKSGLKFEWDFVKKPSSFLYALGFRTHVGFLFGVDYEGEGIWNLRTDWAQNPSFKHEADGYGFEGQIGLFYTPFKHFKMELAYHYLNLDADGTERIFFSDGTTYDTNLDDVSSIRHGILFLLTFYF